MKTAIKVEHLYKTFRSRNNVSRFVKALDDINLQVNSGEILGVLGPNSAGKTTFLNILSTLLLPDKGQVDIFGKRLKTSNYAELKEIFNMASGHSNFPWSLTVKENLNFYGRLYDLRGKALDVKVDSLVEMLGLSDFTNVRFDELSTGTKQKLALAKCLINDPKIIFLDEPTDGLDPDVARKIRKLIIDIFNRTKATILLTTHNMKEAEEMCQRIAFLKQGKLIKLATPDELKKAEGKKDLEDVFISLAENNKKEVFKSLEGNSNASAQRFEEYEVVQRPKGRSVFSWFNRCYAFTYRNFLFATRNFFSFAELVFWPIVSLISIGLLGKYIQLGNNTLAFVLTGAITGGILQVTQLDVAYSLLYETWSKSLKHTMLAPISGNEHLFGSWMIGMLRGSFIFLVLGLSAIWLFGFQFPSFFLTVMFFTGIYLCALLLGMLVSFFILTFGQKAEITAWMMTYIFMLICGVYYPVSILPKMFYYIAQMIPLTYFLEYFRESFGFKPVLSHVLLKGFGLIFVYLWVGLVFLKFSFYQARKNGVIVKLSE